MDEYKWVTPFVKQIWTISAVQLTILGLGMSMSYPSCLLPGLRDPNSTIKVDLHTASWLVSSVSLSSVPGYFLSSFFMNYSGRRIAQILLLLPAIMGWISIYFASNVHTLMIGRILNGISNGGCTSLCVITTGEYMSPEYRGMALNLKTAFFSLGSLLVHILSQYLFWRTIALIALIPCVTAVLITWTWPESPAWLASQKQFERCESAFIWLRGNNELAIKELDKLIKAQIDRKSNTKSSSLDKISDFFKKFTRMDFLKPMFIVFLCMNLMELSGRHFLPAYAFDIINDLTGNKFSFYYILVLDILVIVSTSFSVVLAKLITRRTLLFGTGWAAVALSTIFCAYKLIIPVDKNHSWIPISILIVYFIFAHLGCTPIPLGIMGEILPLAHRAAGSAFGGIFLSFSMYMALQMTPYLLVSIKVGGTFAVLGAGMAVCLLILYFVLPETKDRTLQEIDNFFTYGQYTVDRVDDEHKEEKIKMLDKKLTNA